MAVRMSELNRMDGRQLMGLGWKILGDERRQTAEFLKILATIDRRGLYRNQGFSSMFALCVEGYRLSKGQAYVRIASARAGRRFPVVFEMLARGDVHMSGVALLEKHLTPENHEALLQRTMHKTKDEIGEIVASIAPKPDAPTSIRRIPQRKAATAEPEGQPGLETRPVGEAGAEQAVVRGSGAGLSSSRILAPAHETAIGTPASGTRPESAKAARREVVEPRSPDRFIVKFTASKRCTELMRQAKDLMSHQSPNIDAGELTEAAYELLVRELLKRKHKVTDRPRKAKTNDAKANEESTTDEASEIRKKSATSRPT